MAEQQKIQNPFGVPPMVEQMAQQQFAMKNGGIMQGNGGNRPPSVATVAPQNVFTSGGVVGRFEQPAVQPSTQPLEPVQTGEVPQTNFENMPKQPTGWNPDGSANYDALSQALSGHSPQRQPEFKADNTKRDGGFFSWLGGLIPKARKGQRPGESDEDYDRRMTTNRERLLALGDAMRHLGNIAYTNKYAPVQQFNDPISTEEARYQQRKADRQKKAALDADAAYKQAGLTLKERAAEADRQYKAMNLGFKQAAEERAQRKMDDDNKKWAANYERLLNNDSYNQKMGEAKFKESQRHNQVSEGQGAARIALAQERNQISRARLAHSIATGRGGGKEGSLTNLSTPTGHVNRKKDLSTIEKKQLTQYLIKNGYINKDNLEAYNRYKMTGSFQGANDLQNYWIAYAANMTGSKGDQFRKVLRDHYGYAENVTTAAPASPPKKSVVTVTHSNKTGKAVSKPKSTSNKSKFHVD